MKPTVRDAVREEHAGPATGTSENTATAGTLPRRSGSQSRQPWRAEHVRQATVARRHSTAKDTDEIVVRDSGRIIGRGTHREVLRSNAPYRALVAALRIEPN